MNSAPEQLVDGGERAAARVRGLRAARHVPIHFCRHCGAALAGAAARESGFCCAGCAYVFRLVGEHGLGDYYRIRDPVVAPPDETVFQPRDFGWLAAAQAAAEAAPGTPELVLEVQGVSCAGCVWLIERLFHQHAGALAIETDAPLGRLTLRWGAGFAAADFARTLQSFGYTLGPVTAGAAPSESRPLVRRIGLCAALAMNVMLFTLPVYFGMTADFAYARLFALLSMTFATLSVLAGGGYFFARAAAAVRQRVAHIDLPIAVGIAGAYLGSVYGWLTGREGFVYFDFVSAFILLMLVGRWAQVTAVERNRRRLLSGQARPGTVDVVGADGGLAARAVGEVQAGDALEIGPGQLVPVAAQLVSPAATFGTAWISGEAEPRDCRAGAVVPAGARNVGRVAVRVRATQPWRDSLLAELLRPAARDVYRHRFLERVISGYLSGIFILAGAAGAGWWLATHDGLRTWSVVTAVLVVSCPCAIGLAFPLADELATAALRRRGVFIREGDLWPRLARIRRIVFDKTGTLTLETPVLQNPEALAALAPEARDALFALVRDSLHPVAQSLRQRLLAGDTAPGARGGPDDLREEPGLGVVLVREGIRWSLGRPGWGTGLAAASAGSDAEFGRDGAVVARFHFADSLRLGAREEIAALRGMGFAVSILSGDRAGKVAAMADALGLPAAAAHGGLTPAEKSRWLREHDRRDTLMLGDGANDSLAFDAAFARGTPVVHGGVLEAKADFYYLGQGLGGLRALFEVDRCRRRTHRRLLVFSIIYNLGAVGLAVAGHMNPLLAAILMPVSSLLTLLIVLAGPGPSGPAVL